jgi:S1-C subfamily serine protease
LFVAHQRFRRPAACVLIACAALVIVAGCRSRPDIVGNSPEARAWAEAQRRQEEDSNQLSGAGEARSHPVATPEPRGVPEPLPPAREARPAPAMATAAASRSELELTGFGTGFAIDAEGTIITAHHVVEGSRAVAVVFPGGDSPMVARVVRVAAATDIAVLKVDRPPPDFLPLAPTTDARVGRAVFTMGFPKLDTLGSEPKFTDGTISALSGLRGDASFMQISVPVQPGNSGGPLVTDDGKVVGIVVARYGDLRFLAETGTLPQNVNWASKVQNVRALLSGDAAGARPLRSREAAIERASRAVCIIGAFRDPLQADAPGVSRGGTATLAPGPGSSLDRSGRPDNAGASRLSDAEVRARLIQESIGDYDGPCACPYHHARNGSRCGGRSAYSRRGGEEPLCYPRDVSAEMIEAWRATYDAE